MSRTATLRPRRVRTGAAALAVLAYAGVTLAGAPAAFAQPGDSGDLKIHKAGVPHWDTRDDIKGVCKFSLSAFNFESLELLEWTITPQPPTASGPTLDDSIALIAGRGHTEEYALPDGDYLLTWTIPGPPPETKQKVFTVDCDKYGEKKGDKGPEKNDKIQDGQNGTDWSEGDKGSPHGAVPAGGGGMAGDGGTGGDDGSSVGMSTALVAGAAGLAGLVVVRRARRRSHGAA